MAQDRRLELDKELREILQEGLGYVNIYFQPPETLKMAYDCIRYNWASYDVRYADNRSHVIHTEYEVVFISRNPDTPVPQMIQEHFPMCRALRNYTADNLYHYPFTIYY